MKDLIIKKKKAKSECSCRVVSVRMHSENFERLDLLAKETNLSRNAIINHFITYGLDHCQIK